MSHGDEVIMSGWLRKQSQAMKIWQQRWFVLTKYNIKYFHSPQDTRASGLMAIENVEVLREDGIAFSRRPKTASQIFYLRHPSRTYALSAESVAEAQEWMEAVHRASRGTTTDDTPRIPSRRDDQDSRDDQQGYARAGSDDDRPSNKPTPRTTATATNNSSTTTASASAAPAKPAQPQPKVDSILFDDFLSTPSTTTTTAAPAPAPAPAASGSGALWDWNNTPAAPAPASTPLQPQQTASNDLMSLGAAPAADPTKLKNDILAMYAQQPARPGLGSAAYRPPLPSPAASQPFNPMMGGPSPTNPFAPLTPFGASPAPLVPSSTGPAIGGMKPLIPDNELLGQKKKLESTPSSQSQQKKDPKNAIDIDPFAMFKS